MYNLLVSGNPDAWQGTPWQIEASRCVREYTDDKITKMYGSLDGDAITALKRLPCIFAYEACHEQSPKFGIIRDIKKSGKIATIEYETHDVQPFLTAEDLESLALELDIAKWEMNRTHWAVKDVNLPKELSARQIKLPSWIQAAERRINITNHEFRVSLSFPGESRHFVEKVAADLERRLGPDSYFYDENYVSQLSRPSLDSLLQDIYRNRSKLVVVFIGSNYQNKNWCGIEFRAIRDIINNKGHNRVMFVRMDDGPVEGIFLGDGYVDAKRFGAMDVARFIEERLEILDE